MRESRRYVAKAIALAFALTILIQPMMIPLMPGFFPYTQEDLAPVALWDAKNWKLIGVTSTHRADRLNSFTRTRFDYTTPEGQEIPVYITNDYSFLSWFIDKEYYMSEYYVTKIIGGELSFDAISPALQEIAMDSPSWRYTTDELAYLSGGGNPVGDPMPRSPGPGDDFTNYVDADTSNVDSYGDYGNEGTFSNAQSAPDSSYFSLQEVLIETGDSEDFVDAQSNDHLPTPDVGTHDVFADLQDYGANDDRITEADQGGAGVNEWRYVDSYSDVDWAETGSPEYIDAPDDSNYITGTNGQLTGWSSFADTSGSGTGFTVNVSIYWYATGGDDYVQWEVDWTGDSSADHSGQTTTHLTPAAWATFDLTAAGCDTATEINALTVRLTGNKGGAGPDSSIVDAVRIGISQAGASDYELDLEFEWTSLDYDEENEYVCVYITARENAEDLYLYIWDSAAWTQLGGALNIGSWTNISISSYLDAATEEFRFRDADQASDATSTYWDVDCILIHVWSTDYHIDVEYSWTTADFDEDNEEVCTYVETAVQNGETLQIWEWTGSAWAALSDGLIDANGWNNFTCNYLTSANYYIKYNGTLDNAPTEDDDNQDTWNIDSICIHTWTPVSNFDPVIKDAHSKLSNNDDSNHFLARMRYYQFTFNITDYNGYADISWCSVSFYTEGLGARYWSANYTESTNAFSVEYEAGSYITLGSGDYVKSGNMLNVTFDVYIDWAHIEYSDVDVYYQVRDELGPITVSDSDDLADESNEMDVISDLDLASADFITADSGGGTVDRGDISGTITMSGTVYYTGTSIAPPDAAFTKIVTDEGQGGEDTSIVSGAFSFTVTAEATVTSTAYTLDADMTASGGTTNEFQDAETDSYISDRVIVIDYDVITPADDNVDDVGTTFNITVTVQYEYDNAIVQDGTITVNGNSTTYTNANGKWWWQDSDSDPNLRTYNDVQASGNEHGITTENQNSLSQRIYWERIQVVSYSVDDDRININTQFTNLEVTLVYEVNSTQVTTGTITVNSNATTHEGAGVWEITAYSEASVQMDTFDTVACDGSDTNGITTVNQNSQSQTVIWDQIVVYYEAVDDDRINISTDMEYRIRAVLDYDDHALDQGGSDTVTANSGAMTWDAGNTWWDDQYQRGTVGTYTFQVTAANEASYGITSVTTNQTNPEGIWDEVVFYYQVLDDSRVDINDNIEFRVKAVLDYDDHALDQDGSDTVTANSGAMAWDSGNSWWDDTYTTGSISDYTFQVTAASEATYGITAFSANVTNPLGIFDQLRVTSLTADDTRDNINDNIEVRIVVVYDYDDAEFNSTGPSTLTLNGISMTWDGVNNWWDTTRNQATVTSETYNDITAYTDGNHGLDGTENMDSNTVTIIWDQIVAYWFQLDDSRVDLSTDIEFRARLVLDWDDHVITTGDTVTANTGAMTYDGGNTWWEDWYNEGTVGDHTFQISSASEVTYGITSLTTNTSELVGVWDQIVVYYEQVDDTRVNINTNIEYRIRAVLDYDDHALDQGGSDTVTANAGAMNWDAGNTWWDVTHQEASVSDYTFQVTAGSEATYSITSITTNQSNPVGIWDQIVFYWAQMDDSRVNINTNIEYRLRAVLDYDDHEVGSGDSVTANAGAMSWDGVNTWWDVSHLEAAVTDYTLSVSAASEATYTITSYTNNMSMPTGVYDQIVAYWFQLDDSRVDISTDIEFRARLVLDYDDHVLETGDTVTANTGSMTYDGGNTWWDDQHQEASVTDYTFQISSASEVTYGITSLTTNTSNPTGIYDQIVAYWFQLDDSRVDLSTDIEFRARLVLDYDDHVIESGDTVTANTGAMSYDGGNTWWEDLYNEGVVGDHTFQISSASEVTYGITSLTTNATELLGIWDQIRVTGITDDSGDQRVDLSANVELRLTAVYDYDDAQYNNSASSTLSLNGLAMSWDGVDNRWEYTDSESSVMANTYNDITYSDGNHGLTGAENMDGNSLTVIWDQLRVTSLTADDTRVDINDNSEIRIQVVYDYDDAQYNSSAGSTLTLNGISMTWDSGNSWWDATENEATITSNTYNDITAYTDGNWGLTGTENMDGNSVTVIWDQIKVTSIADDSGDQRVDISASVELRLTAVYDFDDAQFNSSAGSTLTLNGLVMAWDGVNNWWDYSDSESSVMANTYDDITYTDGNWGLDGTENMNGQTLTVIWDQLKVTTLTADDTRVSISENIEVRIQIVYDYDDAQFNSSAGSTLTLNGVSMTWDAGNSWWDTTRNQGTVGDETYNDITAYNDGNWGLTGTENMDSKTVTIIWDRIELFWSEGDLGDYSGGEKIYPGYRVRYEYDSAEVTTGTAHINDTSYTSLTYDATYYWNCTILAPDSNWWVWIFIWNGGDTYSINAFDNSTEATYKCWINDVGEQVQLFWSGVDDGRVNIGGNIEIRMAFRYTTDSANFTDADSNEIWCGRQNAQTSALYENRSMTWDGPNYWWEYTATNASVVGIVFYAYDFEDNTRSATGPSQFMSYNQTAIWDRVQVQSYSVSDSRTGISISVNIDVTIYYDYDNTAVTDGTVTINGNSTSHQGSGVWRASDSSSSVQLRTYNTVAASGNTYGITTVDQNSQSTTVIWDRVEAYWSDIDDGRVNISANIEIRFKFRYDYDDVDITGSDGNFFVGLQNAQTDDIYANKTLTWDGGNTWWDITETNSSVVGIVYYMHSFSEWQYDIDPNTGFMAYNQTGIWDRVQVQSYSRSDDRDDINDSVNIDVTLWYDYDNTLVTDGTITINSNSTSHQGSGVWRATDSSSSVQLRTYNTVAASGNTHGITTVDQNGQSTTVIWDRIKITSTVGDGDQRVDINANQDIHVDAELEYDNHAFDASDTLYIDDTLATWQAGPGNFKITVSQSTVGLWNYFVNSTGANEASYTITVVNLDGQETDLIWDRIHILTTTTQDGRINISTSADIRVTAELEYDSHALDGSDTLNMDDTGMSYVGPYFQYQPSQGSVGLWNYVVNTTGANEATYAITVVNLDGNNVDQIWDRAKVLTTTAQDGRIDISTSADIRVTMELEYDNHAYDASDTVTMNAVGMSWVGPYFQYQPSQASVGLWNYFVNSTNEATYGITALNLDSNNVDVIWDRIKILTTTCDDTRVGINDNVEFRVTAELEYDNHGLGSGDTLYMDDSLMTWDGGDSRFEYITSQSSVGLYTYFVNSSSANEATYGITVINLDSNEQDGIWDRIELFWSEGDLGTVGLGSPVEPRYAIRYEYDLANVTTGTAWTNDTALTSLTYAGSKYWWNNTFNTDAYGVTYWIFVWGGGDTYGIDEFDNSTESTYWCYATVEGVQLFWSGIDDGRVDISGNIEIRMAFRWMSDNANLTGSDASFWAGRQDATTDAIYENRTLTWDAGNYWWEYTATNASVVGIVFYGYDHIDYTRSATGQVDFMTYNQTGIWDRIQVQSYSVSDPRVNISDNVNIDVTLWYDYDNSLVTDGTVTINSNSTSHQGSGVWRATDSSASVQQRTYNTVAASGNTYGITQVDQNSQSTTAIWDRVIVTSHDGYSDGRLDINTDVYIWFTLDYEYDTSDVIDGTVTLNGYSASHISGGQWNATVTESSVAQYTYNTVACSGNTHGITTVDQNGQSTNIIFDRIVVYYQQLDDSRVSINDNIEYRAKACLEYDDHLLGAADTLAANFGALAWDAGNSWFDGTHTEATVQGYTFQEGSGNEVTYDISAITANVTDPVGIFDRVEVYWSASADYYPVIGNAADLQFKLRYEYDSVAVSTGSAWVNGTAEILGWTGSIWYNNTHTEASAITLKFYVIWGGTDTYGINEFDNASATTYMLTIEWVTTPVVVAGGGVGTVPSTCLVDIRQPILTVFQMVTMRVSILQRDESSNITLIELALYNDARSRLYWEVTFDVADNTYYESSDTGDYIKFTSVRWTVMGESFIADFTFIITQNHPSVDNVDFKVYVEDGHNRRAEAWIDECSEIFQEVSIVNEIEIPIIDFSEWVPIIIITVLLIVVFLIAAAYIINRGDDDTPTRKKKRRREWWEDYG